MQPRIDRGPVEYHVTLSHAFVKEKNAPCIRMTIRSTDEFIHFQYRINHSASVTGNLIEVALKGLKTKAVTIPKKGPAEAVIDFFDLHGAYQVQLRKAKTKACSFAIKVTSDTIHILQPPPEDAFISVEIQS